MEMVEQMHAAGATVGPTDMHVWERSAPGNQMEIHPHLGGFGQLAALRADQRQAFADRPHVRPGQVSWESLAQVSSAQRRQHQTYPFAPELETRLSAVAGHEEMRDQVLQARREQRMRRV